MHKNKGAPTVTNSANTIQAQSSEYRKLPINMVFSQHSMSFRRPAFSARLRFSASPLSIPQVLLSNPVDASDTQPPVITRLTTCLCTPDTTPSRPSPKNLSPPFQDSCS